MASKSKMRAIALAVKAKPGQVGVSQEASMVSIASTGAQSVIKDEEDYRAPKANPWVDPSEGPEGAAFRFMTQVEGYLARNWKEFNSHMELLAKGMARTPEDPITGLRGKPVKVGVTIKQERLMNDMRQSVGLHINIKLALCGLSTLVIGLVSLLVFLWFATINVQEQIDAYSTESTFELMEPPPSLDLRLERLTVPFGPESTVCRSFKVNYTSDAHIVAFHARSLGYPFGAHNPVDKVVRTMSLWVSDFSVNATADAGDNSNFFCRRDAPAGAAGRLLWHWSRSAGTDTQFTLPAGVGVLLPGVSQLFLQVDYDVETGNADLRQLTSFDFWQEFEPFDESGIRIELVSGDKLRATSAALVQVGTLDLLVPKMAISSHNYTCHFSEDSPNFRRGAELTVIAGSTRTRGAGTGVSVDVVRPSRIVQEEGDPPPPPPAVVWNSLTGGNSNPGFPGASSDAPALPAHAGLLPLFSQLLPTGQPTADDVELKPLTLEQGDQLRMQCSYNTRYSVQVDATGGWGRGHELCAVYLYVYPASDVLHGVCGSYAGETVDFDGETCSDDP